MEVYAVKWKSCERRRAETSKPKARRRDKQQENAFAVCCQCGGEIYLGQPYYEMPDGAVCVSCLLGYASSYFLSCLRTAIPPEAERYDTF